MVLATAFSLVGSAASAQQHPRPPLWVDADSRDIPEPADRDISEIFGIMYNSWLRHIDIAVMHSHRIALNVNAWDEVPASSWFTNRIGLNPYDGRRASRGRPG